MGVYFNEESLMVTPLRFIYTLSIAIWLGSMFFFTFIASPSVFHVLPGILAGDVVADIFPKYYLVSYICGSLLLLTLLLLLAKRYEPLSTMNSLKLVLIVLMLGLSFYSGEVLREQVAQARAERAQTLEDTEEHIAARERFRTLHTKSVILNLTVFTFGIALVFINTYNYRNK